MHGSIRWFAIVASAGTLSCASNPEAPGDAQTHKNGGTIGTNAVGSHPAGVVATRVLLDSRPFGVAVSKLGEGTYYVTRLDAGVVSGGPFPAFAFPNNVAVGPIPTNVTFDALGTTAYVTNQFSQNVGVIDVASNTQVNTLPISGDPFNVILSADQSTLYVTNNANNVAVIDLASGTVVTTVDMPGAPNGLALDREGTRLYVSVPGNGTVAEVSTSTNTVVRTFTTGGVPQDMAVSADGAELYVANEAGSLDVVDLGTGSLVASVSLPAGAFGLALTPDKVQLYVGQPAGYLTIINRKTRAIVKTLRLEGTPRKIAFNASGKRAVVANEAGWVTFIK